VYDADTQASIRAPLPPAVSALLTGEVLAVEQFGWNTLMPALIVGVAAPVVAGKPGLYVALHWPPSPLGSA